MTIILLVRHADSQETENAAYHSEPLFGGRMDDCPLGKKNGIRQSKELSQAWKKANIKPDAIYSSIAVRAVGTAEPTAKVFGLPVNRVKDLRELTWGDWESNPRSILEEEPFRTQRWEQEFNFRPPGGESHNDVQKRGMRELWEIHTESQKKSRELVLVFSHQNVIKNVIREPMGWRTPAKLEAAKLGVCSLTTVRFRSGGKLEVVEFNKQLI